MLKREGYHVEFFTFKYLVKFSFLEKRRGGGKFRFENSGLTAEFQVSQFVHDWKRKRKKAKRNIAD